MPIGLSNVLHIFAKQIKRVLKQRSIVGRPKSSYMMLFSIQWPIKRFCKLEELQCKALTDHTVSSGMARSDRVHKVTLISNTLIEFCRDC